MLIKFEHKGGGTFALKREAVSACLISQKLKEKQRPKIVLDHTSEWWYTISESEVENDNSYRYRQDQEIHTTRQQVVD